MNTKSVEKQIKERTGCDAIFEVTLKGNGYKPVCRIDAGVTGVQAMIYFDASWSDDKIVEHIISQYEKHVKDNSKVADDIITKWMQSLSTKEAILRNIYPTFINGKVDIPSDIPSVPLLDLNIIYRIIMDDSSSIVRKQMLDYYEITPEEMYEAGLRNAGTRATVNSISEQMGFPDCDDAGVMVITYPDHHYGAGAILSHDVAEQVKKRMGADSFYIIPSSVHELICLPTNIIAPAIKGMIYEINRSGEVNPDEYLSDTLYLYRNDRMEVV